MQLRHGYFLPLVFFLLVAAIAADGHTTQQHQQRLELFRSLKKRMQATMDRGILAYNRHHTSTDAKGPEGKEKENATKSNTSGSGCGTSSSQLPPHAPLGTISPCPKSLALSVMFNPECGNLSIAAGNEHCWLPQLPSSADVIGFAPGTRAILQKEQKYIPLIVTGIVVANNATITMHGGALSIVYCGVVEGNVILDAGPNPEVTARPASSTDPFIPGSNPEGTDCSVVPIGFTPRICGPGTLVLQSQGTALDMKGLYSSLFAATVINTPETILKAHNNSFIWGNISNFGVFVATHNVYMHGFLYNYADASIGTFTFDKWATKFVQSPPMLIVNNGSIHIFENIFATAASYSADHSQGFYNGQLENHGLVWMHVSTTFNMVSGVFDITNHKNVTWVSEPALSSTTTERARKIEYDTSKNSSSNNANIAPCSLKKKRMTESRSDHEKSINATDTNGMTASIVVSSVDIYRSTMLRSSSKHTSSSSFSSLEDEENNYVSSTQQEAQSKKDSSCSDSRRQSNSNNNNNKNNTTESTATYTSHYFSNGNCINYATFTSNAVDVLLGPYTSKNGHLSTLNGGTFHMGPGSFHQKPLETIATSHHHRISSEEKSHVKKPLNADHRTAERNVDFFVRTMQLLLSEEEKRPISTPNKKNEGEEGNRQRSSWRTTKERELSSHITRNFTYLQLIDPSQSAAVHCLQYASEVCYGLEDAYLMSMEPKEKKKKLLLSFDQWIRFLQSSDLPVTKNRKGWFGMLSSPHASTTKINKVKEDRLGSSLLQSPVPSFSSNHIFLGNSTIGGDGTGSVLFASPVIVDGVLSVENGGKLFLLVEHFQPAWLPLRENSLSSFSSLGGSYLEAQNGGEIIWAGEARMPFIHHHHAAATHSHRALRSSSDGLNSHQRETSTTNTVSRNSEREFTEEEKQARTTIAAARGSGSGGVLHVEEVRLVLRTGSTFSLPSHATMLLETDMSARRLASLAVKLKEEEEKEVKRRWRLASVLSKEKETTKDNGKEQEQRTNDERQQRDKEKERASLAFNGAGIQMENGVMLRVRGSVEGKT